jgi:hypothetical protein
VRRLLLVGTLAAAAGSSVAVSVTLAAASPPSLQLEPGDRFRVAGAEIGCRVAQISELGGRTVVDCRRGGPLAGTYGAMVSEREAVIVQFRSGQRAKIVFQAAHEGKAERCR